MGQNWMIDVLINGETEKKQICLSAVNAGQKRYINTEYESDVLLYIDEDELVIERVGRAEVAVKRGVRERMLPPAHPMRLLPKDLIRMGACEYQIENIYPQSVSSRTPSPFTQHANKALLVGAVAIMMASVPACAPKKAPENTNTQAVEQTQEIKQDAANDAANAEGANTQAVEQTQEIKQNSVDDTPNVENDVKQDAANDENDIKQDAAIDENDIKQDNTAPCDKIKVMCLNNNRYEQCGNEPWKLIETCKVPSLCKVNYKDDVAETTYCDITDPCQEGTYICFGGALHCENSPGIGCHRDNQMYQCINQQWVLKKECQTDERCQLQSDNTQADCVKYPRPMGKPKVYDECKSGQNQCDSNAIMDCKMGKWHYQSVCSYGETCKVDEMGEASCVPERKG